MSNTEELWLEGGGMREVYTDEYIESLRARVAELEDRSITDAGIIGDLQRQLAACEKRHRTAIRIGQERIAARDEQLAACEKELEDAYKAVDTTWISHQQLVASQAREHQLRKALEYLSHHKLWANTHAKAVIDAAMKE
jgi:hypothetical protein